MRVLAVRPGPHFSVADVYRGWLKALVGMGCDVVDFNLDDRLGFYSQAGRLRAEDGEFVRMVDETGAVRLAAKGLEAACYEFWPDVVLIVSGFYIPLDVMDLIRARGTKVVLLHTESPYEDDRQLGRAAHADLNLLNDPTNLEAFQALAPSLYIPHAYDSDLHRPAPASAGTASDFCLVGTGYPSRIQFLEAVDWAGIDVALAGNWQSLTEHSPLRGFVAHDLADCIDNEQAVELYRGAKASANLYRREAERPELSAGWAMGPREVELAATGCFYLTEARGENREVLPMVPAFEGPEDFAEQLRWYLAHDEARTRVTQAARAAIEPRTFAANAARALSALDL